MIYKIAPNIDPNKIFLVNRSELDGRLEVEYYLPRINKIEKAIRARSTKKLKNFIIKISSGATPSIAEEEKFYSNQENGIPFLRVQNLQSNGKLSVDDVKFIKWETHEGYLKRSQVAENDLLVKITGVGRMAIASVAPKGFVGNTNQHMVVIKTGSKEISEYLANYLNLDIIEKISSRRSYGATRPALDYPALKSIPIIENIDFSVIEKAEIIKQQKESEAKVFIESIDDYLLTQLGIKLPEHDNSLQNRIFTTMFREVTGSRIDPKLYDNNTKALKKSIRKSCYSTVPLKSLISQSIAGDWGKDENEDLGGDFVKSLVIRATEFDNHYNLKLENSRVKYRLIHKDKLAKIDIQENDLLIEKSGGSPDQPVGRIAIITEDMIKENHLCYSNFIHKIRVDNSRVNPNYLFFLLKTFHNIKLTDSMQSQTNGIRNLIMREYFNQAIPLPFMEDPQKSLKKQAEIAQHIHSLNVQAQVLQEKATLVLAEAKRQIERMIIG